MGLCRLHQDLTGVCFQEVVERFRKLEVYVQKGG